MTQYGIFRGVRTSYRKSGEGKDVILLHGWGQNMQMMEQIEHHLCTMFSVWNLDFPGFGESDLPPEPWGVSDYEDFLADFIVQNHIENPILIAHSFGCRVAIRYAADHPSEVRKMCLTGAAGKKLEELQNRSGSEDYRNAKGVMRPTFVKVVNDDVSPILNEVVCPVLLVWGEYDTAVPLEMGRQMEREMPDAGLAIFEGDDHFAYWHQPERFTRVLDIFLKEDHA